MNYLLILGDENIIPPIYNGSTPSDDFYTSSGNLAANPQLATGRIPINNTEDANSIILKIQLYYLVPKILVCQIKILDWLIFYLPFLLIIKINHLIYHMQFQ